MDNELRREIIMDNYQYPYNREVPSNLEGYIKVNSNIKITTKGSARQSIKEAINEN